MKVEFPTDNLEIRAPITIKLVLETREDVEAFEEYFNCKVTITGTVEPKRKGKITK